jgi:hypothetical protein
VVANSRDEALQALASDPEKDDLYQDADRLNEYRHGGIVLAAYPEPKGSVLGGGRIHMVTELINLKGDIEIGAGGRLAGEVMVGIPVFLARGQVGSLLPALDVGFDVYTSDMNAMHEQSFNSAQIGLGLIYSNPFFTTGVAGGVLGENRGHSDGWDKNYQRLSEGRSGGYLKAYVAMKNVYLESQCSFSGGQDAKAEWEAPSEDDDDEVALQNALIRDDTRSWCRVNGELYIARRLPMVGAEITHIGAKKIASDNALNAPLNGPRLSVYLTFGSDMFSK